MEEPVTIVDRDILKVLAVETRMDILKELSEGSRTPSDLSKKLKKSNSTIVEHLDVMVKSGLVTKVEHPGKKWIFYSLTDRGYGIISSKSRRLVIILATSLISVVGGLYTLNLHSRQFISADTSAEALQAGAKAVSAQAIAPPIFLYLSIALFTIGVAGLAYYSIQKIKYKV